MYCACIVCVCVCVFMIHLLCIILFCVIIYQYHLSFQIISYLIKNLIPIANIIKTKLVQKSSRKSLGFPIWMSTGTAFWPTLGAHESQLTWICCFVWRALLGGFLCQMKTCVKWKLQLSKRGWMLECRLQLGFPDITTGYSGDFEFTLFSKKSYTARLDLSFGGFEFILFLKEKSTNLQIIVRHCLQCQI